MRGFTFSKKCQIGFCNKTLKKCAKNIMKIIQTGQITYQCDRKSISDYSGHLRPIPADFLSFSFLKELHFLRCSYLHAKTYFSKNAFKNVIWWIRSNIGLWLNQFIFQFITHMNSKGIQIYPGSGTSWDRAKNCYPPKSHDCMPVESEFAETLSRCSGRLRAPGEKQKQTAGHADVKERAWWTLHKPNHRGHSKNNWLAAENHAGDHWS